MRQQHGHDASYHPCAPPDAVAFAESSEEVSEIVKICAQHEVPIIPFGSGSGLEGHVAALRGGVTIDISRLNKILQVNPADLDATVQAGVTHKQLNEYLRDTGLFFFRRSGGRCYSRRNGGDACFGHYGGALRNHEGERLIAQSSLTGWSHYSHGASSAEVLGRLRPDPPLRGIRGNARGVHRGHGPAPWRSSLDFSCNVLFPQCRSRSEHRNADHPGGHSGCSDGVRGRDSHGGNHSVFKARLAGCARALDGVPRHREKRGGASYDGQGIAEDHGGAHFAWATDAEERRKLWQARHDAYYAWKATRQVWRLL